MPLPTQTLFNFMDGNQSRLITIDAETIFRLFGKYNPIHKGARITLHDVAYEVDNIVSEVHGRQLIHDGKEESGCYLDNTAGPYCVNMLIYITPRN